MPEKGSSILNLIPLNNSITRLVNVVELVLLRWSIFVYKVVSSERPNIDLAKLIFIRVWYVYADPINWIKTKYKLRIQLIVSQQINF